MWYNKFHLFETKKSVTRSPIVSDVTLNNGLVMQGHIRYRVMMTYSDWAH